MSWICPNGCHKRVPGWRVMRRKLVEYYAAEDKRLSAGKLQTSVCAGNVRGKPVCSTCDARVTWEEPPAASKANVYRITWETTKGDICTTDPIGVHFAGGDVIAEYIMVLASLRAQFRKPSKVARIVKVEICEKDPT